MKWIHTATSHTNIVIVIAIKKMEKTMILMTPPVLILPRVIVYPFPIKTSRIRNTAWPANSRKRPKNICEDKLIVQQPFEMLCTTLFKTRKVQI